MRWGRVAGSDLSRLPAAISGCRNHGGGDHRSSGGAGAADVPAREAEGGEQALPQRCGAGARPGGTGGVGKRGFSRERHRRPARGSAGRHAGAAVPAMVLATVEAMGGGVLAGASLILREPSRGGGWSWRGWGRRWTSGFCGAGARDPPGSSADPALRRRDPEFVRWRADARGGARPAEAHGPIAPTSVRAGG